MRRKLTGWMFISGWLLSSCAMGVGEERAEPPPPPRLDGSTGGFGGSDWPGAGFGGDGGDGGDGGGAGIPAAAGFGATGAVAGAAGIPSAGFGGSANCTPGEIMDLGACGMCGKLQNVCDEFGNWGAVTCMDQKTCLPDDKDTASCGNCGTKTRVCNDACEWGAWSSCTNEGCAPGATKDCMCSTNASGTITACCGQQVCNTQCQWETCGLKPTSKCDWNAGHTYRCCGTGQWEYCLSDCNWSGNCAPCTNCCP